MRILLALLLTAPLAAQSTPEPFHPDTTLKALWLADSVARTGDAVTTYLMLKDSCHCIHERDPIAPHSANAAAIGAFQAGMYVGIHFGSVLLEKHHHDKWAKTLVSVDLADEGVAVVNNAMLLRGAK